MRIFLPGWGSTAEVWAPFAAPGDRLGGEIEAGAEVVAWSLGRDAGARGGDERTSSLRSRSSAPLGSSCAGASTGTAGPSGRSCDARASGRRCRRRSGRFLDARPRARRRGAAPPREQDAALLEQGLAFLADYSMLERAAQIPCPVRLLHGGRDRVCPLAAAELLARALPPAELTVWPEAGHAPFLTNPTASAHGSCPSARQAGDPPPLRAGGRLLRHLQRRPARDGRPPRRAAGARAALDPGAWLRHRLPDRALTRALSAGGDRGGRLRAGDGRKSAPSGSRAPVFSSATSRSSSPSPTAMT